MLLISRSFEIRLFVLVRLELVGVAAAAGFMFIFEEFFRLISFDEGDMDDD